jgi:hypothetical protein
MFGLVLVDLNRCDVMPDRHTLRGHLVDLRRHVTVHWRHLHPIAPTDRYELWLPAPDAHRAQVHRPHAGDAGAPRA